MDTFLTSIVTTVVKRPYVFAFLIAYLLLSLRRWGWRRSLLWLVSAYAIAWLSEYSSITNGFPYGEYHYVYENLTGELLLKGVPFFDSLSYVFLIFAGLTTAEFVSRNVFEYGRDRFLKLYFGLPVSTVEAMVGGRKKWSATGCFVTVFLGALFTMLLDVVIDPIATMGDRWFLGKIHFYAHPGSYYGVPLTNFAGWFLVPFVVIVFNVIIWRTFPVFFNVQGDSTCWMRTRFRDYNEEEQQERDSDKRHDVLYPLFYIGIVLFNSVIAFSLKEWFLGSTGIVLSLIVLVILMIGLQSGRARQRK